MRFSRQICCKQVLQNAAAIPEKKLINLYTIFEPICTPNINSVVNLFE